MTTTGTEPLNFARCILPVKHPTGRCAVCGCTREHVRGVGGAFAMPELCTLCLEEAREILEPPRSRQLDVLARIASETNPNLLAWCRHNARGDWRRLALANRLAALLKGA